MLHALDDIKRAARDLDQRYVALDLVAGRELRVIARKFRVFQGVLAALDGNSAADVRHGNERKIFEVRARDEQSVVFYISDSVFSVGDRRRDPFVFVFFGRE